MRIFVIIAFIGILGSLGSALFYLMRDKGTSNKTVNALTLRIGHAFQQASDFHRLRPLI